MNESHVRQGGLEDPYEGHLWPICLGDVALVLLQTYCCIYLPWHPLCLSGDMAHGDVLRQPIHTPPMATSRHVSACNVLVCTNSLSSY